MARKAGLTLGQVVREATAIADREGLPAVTLARVAADLGVRSPSLYSHVDGLAGLRRAMALDAAIRLGAEITEALRGPEGAEALVEVAHAYRRFAHAHPGLYAAMLPAPSPAEDPELARAFAVPAGAIAAVLGELGVAEKDTVPLIRSLRSGLHGFVSLEASGGFGLPHDVDASFATLVAVLVAGIEAAARPS